MKKFSLIVLLSLVLFGSFFSFSQANAEATESKPLNIYLFYGDGCPHCAHEKEFLNVVKNEYHSQINIYMFEIYYNSDNVDMLTQVANSLGVDVGGVPFLIIGDQELIGYGGDESTGKDIVDRIDYCLESQCSDSTKAFIPIDENTEQILGEHTADEDLIDNIRSGGDDESSEDAEESSSSNTIDLPIFGKVDLEDLSLPVATFLIAFMDGFNPCAMWILIFLITMLINMKDKKRLYILGSIFIFTSGLVYFVFLAAWLNFFKFVGYVYWIKVIIGIVAIVCGVLHLRDAMKKEVVCHVVNEKNRMTIMQRIKNITKEKSFYLAAIGIIVLAVSVNMIELVCSAGLPAVYTNLLSSTDLPIVEHYGYLLFYTLIFMLDDLVIFFIAVKSFEITGMSQKYTKWSSIVGGIVILIIGILLILKPEVLMFG